MNVLALTRYGATGASSRLRIRQYIPFLRELGISVEARQFFHDGYLDDRYSGRRDAGRVATSYLRRAAAMAEVRKYERVWLQGEAFPWLPFLFESPLHRKGLVIDYDDALFHRYDAHHSRLVRWVLGRKVDRLMRGSAVIAGNGYIAERATRAGAATVDIVPTSVDTDRYQPRAEAAKRTSPFTIGWIGTPLTAKYLELLMPALKRLRESGSLRLLLIGSGEVAVPEGVDASVVPWSEETEVALLHEIDVGVMPLPDLPFERGKSGYKLIQYMAVAAPVVASPVGANLDIIDSGVTGYFASSTEEWVSALVRLRDNEAEARRIGRAARDEVVRNYSVQSNVIRIADILRPTI